jgi:hypothetical protein
MFTNDTIPASIYNSVALANALKYVLLDEVVKADFIEDYGFMSPLTDDFESSCDLAEERFFYNQHGYVIAFDPSVERFVAFTSAPEVEIIEAKEQGVFDSIVDEATVQEDTIVAVADGVAHITTPTRICIAVMGE